MIIIKLRFLQLKLDLFYDPRIRKLKQTTNGYIMLVIYLYMLTLALENDGYIIFDSHFDNLGEQLSYSMQDEKKSDIEATIAYCVALGLIRIIGFKEKLYFPYFSTMTSNYKQLSVSNTHKVHKKELSNSPGAIRQRRYRANKKRKLEEKK